MFFISEGQTLLLVLVVLYLSECIIWMKRQSLAFISGSGRVAFPHQWLGNASGGILFLNPLPPAGKVFLSHLSPISISRTGICAFNSQTLPSGVRTPTQNGRSLSFREIKAAGNDGAYLLVNGEKFAKCATPRQARKLATLIGAMVKASPSKRESLARSWVAKQFDATEAAAQLRERTKDIKAMQVSCWIYFIYLFLLSPLLVSYFGLLAVFLPIVLCIVFAAIALGTQFYRAHKRFYPEEKSERLEGLVKMVLCPPALIRAADLLTRNLLADYSPVVLADLFTSNRERRFVRAFILDLQYPLKHEVEDETARSIINWTATEQLRASLEFIKGDRFGDPEALMAPVQREGSSISYCPRCGCQFVVHSVDCADCPGVPLVAFADRIEVATGGAVSQTIPHG